ncbi:MAG: DUF3185 family protein [Pseudomonadota bacterium]
MSPTTMIGLALLILGIALAYLGLHLSDSFFLLQSSILHFFEHMQMLWGDMARMPRVYLAGGAALIIIGLLLMLIPKRRNHRRGEFF